jgi:hypothetical protein
MISDSKRKQLEAAGYKVGKSGKTVQTKEGGTVAGINSNGNLFGSGKALDILKGEAKPTKTKEQPKSKSTSKPKASAAPKESKRPMRRTGKMSDDAKAARTADTTPKKTTTTTSGPSTRQSNKPTKSKGTSEGTTLLRSPSKNVTYPEWDSMSRSERRAAGLPETILGWQNQNWVSGFKKWKERIGGGGEPSEGSSSRKNTRGMAKGGMVRKGNTDYKNKGMFYKSESPRGYK